jgi:hypothetical protein
MGLGLAFRCFFRVLGGKPLPADLPRELLPRTEPERPALPAAPTLEEQAQAIQLLGLLQKEGRLLDFLQEQIDGYEDAQIGAAVRTIHRDCRKVLEEYVGIGPVLAGQEESQVSVEPGFDPSRIRLIGNVTGEPPFAGVLKHHGWRATHIKLPRAPEGHDRTVIAPAEVELP